MAGLGPFLERWTRALILYDALRRPGIQKPVAEVRMFRRLPWLWGVGLDGGDAVVAGLGGGVGFAGADDFVVGGLEVEHELTVFGFFALVAGFVGGVLFDGCDAVFGRGFLLVHLAGQDDLPVGCLEVKVKLAVFCFLDFKGACHSSSLDLWSFNAQPRPVCELRLKL